MTPERWQRICELFDRARQSDPEARDALLRTACDGDPDLRAQVERLLADDHAASRDGFLDLPTASVAPAGPILERPGDRVGPYKVLQSLGEGGMGIVFLAEQDHPVRRRVALKLIKPGMDSAQVIARFAAERQALAMMDHPNIARVLDAGATDAGRPYFVMDLVKGVPITDYCDHNKLTTGQRLELFIAVCRAIQHAHQKGIIHRDIKPSNVLVAVVDGHPVPKVIDFGVAKAIEQRLTERTIYTQLGALVGTPEYMSPEQAGLSALDVDTRSDVYSLGVLLYELLTGSTPLERGRLRGAAYAEIARRIQEDEPPRPSTRLSGSGDQLASIAARRGVEPSRLARLVRGELDWIAMRCLEKDRTRRYETAGSLARDVERYLSGEAVEAGPPSAWYQVGKLARRHQAALVTVSSFAGLLVVGAAISAALAFRAVRAEATTAQALAETRAAKAKTEEALKESEDSRNRAEAVSQFLVEAFRKPDPSLDGEKVTVAAVLDQAALELGDRFAGSPHIRGDLLNALGQTYMGLGLYEKAVGAHERALSVFREAMGPDHPDAFTGRLNLAAAYHRAGRVKDAIDLLERMRALSEARPSPEHRHTLISRNNLAVAYSDAGRVPEAIDLLERTLALSEARLGLDNPHTLAIRNTLALAYSHAGRLPEAIAMDEATLKLREARLGPDHPDTLTTRNNLAAAYYHTGRLKDAIAMGEANLKLREARLGPDHPVTLISRNNLAQAYSHVGRVKEAIAMDEATLKLMESRLGADHPDTLATRNNHALAYLNAGRVEDAIALFQPALELMESRLGPDHPTTLQSRSNLAVAYFRAGRLPEAIAMHERALTLLEAKLGPDHPTTLQGRDNLAEAYERVDRWTDAEPPRRAILAHRRRTGKPDSQALDNALAALGENLIRQRKWADAEPLLRECLGIRRTTYAGAWPLYVTMSYLGASLLGQARYAEAEPLLIDGYDGLSLRRAQLTGTLRHFVTEAENRIVALYEAWRKPDQARAWQAKLGRAALPADVFVPPAAAEGETGGP